MSCKTFKALPIDCVSHTCDIAARGHLLVVRGHLLRSVPKQRDGWEVFTSRQFGQAVQAIHGAGNVGLPNRRRACEAIVTSFERAHCALIIGVARHNHYLTGQPGVNLQLILGSHPTGAKVCIARRRLWNIRHDAMRVFPIGRARRQLDTMNDNCIAVSHYHSRFTVKSACRRPIRKSAATGPHTRQTLVHPTLAQTCNVTPIFRRKVSITIKTDKSEVCQTLTNRSD